MRLRGASKMVLGTALAGFVFTGGVAQAAEPTLPSANFVSPQEKPGEQYIIGPLDQLDHLRLAQSGAGRQGAGPSRRAHHHAADRRSAGGGQTPAQLADDIKDRLSKYVNDPLVSVIVENFSGTYSQQIRIVGATEKPASAALSRQHDAARRDDRGRRPVPIRGR